MGRWSLDRYRRGEGNRLESGPSHRRSNLRTGNRLVVPPVGVGGRRMHPGRSFKHLLFSCSMMAMLVRFKAGPLISLVHTAENGTSNRTNFNQIFYTRTGPCPYVPMGMGPNSPNKPIHIEVFNIALAGINYKHSVPAVAHNQARC